MRSRRNCHGFVTAETAVALPALVLLAGALIWGVVAVTAQLRCVDAARLAARALARGESHSASVSAATAAAPGGAAVQVSRAGSLIRVEVRAVVRPTDGLLARLPGFGVTGDATAAVEEVDSGGGG
jgi:Flp pilus assembly protein TadG